MTEPIEYCDNEHDWVTDGEMVITSYSDLTQSSETRLRCRKCKLRFHMLWDSTGQTIRYDPEQPLDNDGGWCG